MGTKMVDMLGNITDSALRQVHETPFTQLAAIYGIYDFLSPEKKSYNAQEYKVLVVKDDAEANSISYLGENARVVLLDEVHEILKHPGCEIHISRGALGVLLYQGNSCISVLTQALYLLRDQSRSRRHELIVEVQTEKQLHENTAANFRAEVLKLQAETKALRLQAQEDEKALAAAELCGGSKEAKKKAKELVTRNKSLEKRVSILESENEALRAQVNN